MNNRTLIKISILAITLTATGAAQQNNGGRGAPPPPLLLTVQGFDDGSPVPIKYSCSGQPAGGISPAMEWKQAPPTTQSFLVLLHDPEPHPGRGVMDVTHWLIWNIPGSASGLPENVPHGETLPDGSHQVTRGNGPQAVAGYFGPCAPPGPDHHYTYEVWALDVKLDLPANASRADIMKAAEGHILGAAEWIGRFHRTTN